MLQRARGDRLGQAGSTAASESGFTLIELMVVLLIMGILLAIAVPAFLGASGGAKYKSAEANLNTTLTDAQAAYAGASSYETDGLGTPATATQDLVKAATGVLIVDEPSMSFVGPAVATPGTTCAAAAVSCVVVAANATTAQGILLIAQSTNGVCFAISESAAVMTGLAASTATGTTLAAWTWPTYVAGDLPGTYYGAWVSGATAGDTCSLTGAAALPDAAGTAGDWTSAGFPTTPNTTI